MAQDNSNSTMEMGTSDQVLVASKTKKTTYLIGFVAMLIAIGVVVALVVVFSGNQGGSAEAIISTTEGPTIPVPISPTTQAPVTTTQGPSTTEPPVTDPPEPELAPLDLEDIITGAFAPSPFNATFTSGSDLLYRNENGDLVIYDIDTNTTTPLIYNSSEILQQSSRVTELSPDGTHVVLSHSVIPVYRYSFLARYTVVDIMNDNQVDIIPPTLPVDQEPFLQNFQWGPSGTSFAYVYLNNIYYQSNLSSNPQQITTNGQRDVIYHGIPDWVYEEEVFGTNNALWFSKDGAKLAYATFDDTNVRIMRVPHYGTPGSVSYQYTAHHEIRYPKPGTTNPTVSVTLRDLNTNVSTIYNSPTDIEQPILKTVTFVGNDTIALMWTNRVQTMFRVQLCRHADTTCSQIYQYTENAGWIDNIPLIFNNNGNSFITILPQAVNGVLYKQIVQVSDINAQQWTNAGRTNTPHTVTEILRWTSDDIVWYKATRVNDSAEQHIYSVDASGNVDCFTCTIRRPDGGECLYNDAVMSESADRIAVTCAGPDVPQVYIYDTVDNGTLISLWEDNSVTAAAVAIRAVPATIRMTAPGAAGMPEADVLIQVPADYANRTNVPLLVYVYAGPDTALVTKQWNLDWGSSLVSRWGVAVAQVDGRGSGLRGVANMFAVNRALGTVEIEDQITVTKYLQDTLPWVDANRTCIWGWSYGGYAASLALARGGDVFRCAAAVAPVVDWHFYDTIYTERYMDVPNNNSLGYAQSSLLTNEVVEAYRNKSYFLIHGTADDNVHYQHAMLFSRLLQRRDVYFTQMSYTDEDHSLVGVRPHLYHAIEKFLEEHML